MLPRERGLIKPGTGVAAEPAAGFVTGIAFDSRTVELGNVFVALKGLHADGALFAQQAIERGAVAVVSEQPPPSSVSVPWVVVEDARLALALLADAFHHHPSGELQVVGITGTNGKTTTAYLIAAIFEAAGIPVRHPRNGRVQDRRRCARGDSHDAGSPEVQGLLRDMVTAGCGACAMEVSSHALRCGGSTGSRSRPPSSRTSRAITSTSTRTWRRTFRRSGACSRCCRATRRA